MILTKAMRQTIGNPMLSPAGFWLRFFAYILDYWIQGVLYFLIVSGIFIGFGTGIASYMEGFHFEKSALQGLFMQLADYSWLVALVVIAPFLLMTLYFSGFESSPLKATPGKWLLGLVVTDANDNRVSFSQAFMRNFYKQIPYFLPFVAIAIIVVLAKIAPVLILVSPVIMIGSLIGMFVLTLVMYLMVAFSTHKQALYDKWTHSHVQKRDDTPQMQRVVAVMISVALVIVSFGGGISSIFSEYLIKNASKSLVENYGDKIVTSTKKNKNSKVKNTLPSSLKIDKKHKALVSAETVPKTFEDTANGLEVEKVKKEGRSFSDAIKDHADSQEKSLRILKRGKEIAFGGVKNAETKSQDIVPVVTESLSGQVKIGSKRRKFVKIRSTLLKQKRVIRLDFYAKSKEGRVLSVPSIRLLLSYNTSVGACLKKDFKGYVLQFHAKHFGIKGQKNDDYVSITRSAKDVYLNESIHISCQREPTSGWIRVNSRGEDAILFFGTRYPIRWQLKTEKFF